MSVCITYPRTENNKNNNNNNTTTNNCSNIYNIDHIYIYIYNSNEQYLIMSEDLCWTSFLRWVKTLCNQSNPK